VVDAVVVWSRLVGAGIRSQLQYRTSFALDFLGSFLIAFLDFLAVLVIFHNTPRLAEWSVHEVAFLYALSSICFALTDLAIGHLDLFPQLIRDGNFDVLLVRPRGTLLQVIARDFQLRRLGKAAQGSIVLVYALSSLHVDWTLSRIGVLAASLVAGVVIFASVWILFACIAFWTVDGGEFTNAFTYGGNYLAQYPIDIYGAWVRRFLAYVVPLGFVCYFPALYVLGKQDPLGLPRVLQFLSPAVALAAACAAGVCWRFCVRRYRSAGG
jgi:ABC-2 type transport system permease protein